MQMFRAFLGCSSADLGQLTPNDSVVQIRETSPDICMTWHCCVYLLPSVYSITNMPAYLHIFMALFIYFFIKIRDKNSRKHREYGLDESCSQW